MFLGSKCLIQQFRSLLVDQLEAPVGSVFDPLGLVSVSLLHLLGKEFVGQFLLLHDTKRWNDAITEHKANRVHV